MIRSRSTKAAVAAFAVSLSVLAAGCGGTGATSTEASAPPSGQVIQSNADNAKVTLTIGSKNFTEEFILGEIYAQALEAAGYDVKTDLNLGSEQIALKSLEDGEISGYPEYTSTALTSFFDVDAADIPSDPNQAVDQASKDFADKGLVAFPPTDFTSANAVGMLKSKADELGVTKVSDLEGKSQDLTLYGSPECRQRVDCLLGLEDGYGLKFAKFVPVDIGLRYEVLDKGQADLSILFTTDAQLSQSDDYVTLEDDKAVFPPGNITFVASQDAVDEAGPDFEKTVELVQGGLTEEVMQELNARVDIDREKPADVAAEYLKEAGYTQ
ncbi:MAG: osmoprotectant transport system substrate-binding protein opuBD [Thermoleophilaceae bacterium]|nr:osmoprotectant transport system substrate-binding protein opuBD [Thermoleophilaceae bacterium]